MFKSADRKIAYVNDIHIYICMHRFVLALLLNHRSLAEFPDKEEQSRTSKLLSKPIYINLLL